MLAVETNYANLIPQTAVPGFAPRGKSLHWTAGATGREGALGTIRHFQNTRYTVNASYHLLVWWDAIARITGAMWIVPPTKASHSMNPAKAYQLHRDKDRATQEARFAEVRRILGLKAADPNAGCLSISFCGMPADLAAALKAPEFVADMRQLVAELDLIVSMVERGLFNHGWIQPISRYDAGEALIPAIYAALDAQEDDMATPALSYVPQLWRTGANGADLREQADLAAPKVGHIPAGTVVFTVGETADGLWRLAIAGDRERLYFVRRPVMTPLPPTPRDPELAAGIAAVVDLRINGEAVVFGESDCAGQVAQAQQETTAAINRRWREWLATAPRS